MNKRLLWLYSESAADHPFIRLSVGTLEQNEYQVFISDFTEKSLWRPIGKSNHIPAQVGSPFRGDKNILKKFWSRLCLILSLLNFFRIGIYLRPSIIVCSLPFDLWVGAVLKNLLRCRLVYYPFELFGEQPGKVFGGSKWAEKMVLKYFVDGLLTQNLMRGKVYSDERGSRVEPRIVRNFKPRKNISPVGDLRARLGVPETDKLVVYEGYLVHGRWLDHLIESVRYFDDQTHLVLIGKGFKWWQDKMLPYIATFPRRQNIHILPWMPADELLNTIADADVGVIIYDDSVRNNYFCEPGKLTDYLSAGLPILAPEFPSIAPLFLQYNIGKTFSDPSPKKIADSISELLMTDKRKWKEDIERALKILNWDSQKNELLLGISGASSASGPSPRI